MNTLFFYTDLLTHGQRQEIKIRIIGRQNFNLSLIKKKKHGHEGKKKRKPN